MRCAPEHALSMLNPNSFVLKWKRVVSVLSPLSLFSRGGSHMLMYPRDQVTFINEKVQRQEVGKMYVEYT